MNSSELRATKNSLRILTTNNSGGAYFKLWAQRHGPVLIDEVERLQAQAEQLAEDVHGALVLLDDTNHPVEFFGGAYRVLDEALAAYEASKEKHDASQKLG